MIGPTTGPAPRPDATDGHPERAAPPTGHDRTTDGPAVDPPSTPRPVSIPRRAASFPGRPRLVPGPTPPRSRADPASFPRRPPHRPPVDLTPARVPAG
ncbi:hypothetical protein [Streptomyces sp. NBC_00094]|uniref:hypothetical protein n=1 Tax=Streptomyces sp. NBC_00094 TaxID=2903620 RepID=UPI002255A46B|nr:hypothetical protein [Streptomyces sp. NBC_00094]MCX5389149.1 hypothetical protein [Streptomyces sp. NBC_00094]